MSEAIAIVWVLLGLLVVVMLGHLLVRMARRVDLDPDEHDR